MSGRLNKQGNWLEEQTFFMRERSHYDQKFFNEPGWHSFWTTQDASYFGVWYNPKKKVVVTFCEGDESIVSCPTKEAFSKEMIAVNEFYGHC